MKKFICIFLLLVISIQSFATCILIIKTDKSIFAAADSRSRVYNMMDGNAVKVNYSICKIHHVGGIYFAVAGHGDKNLTNEATLALRKQKSLDKAIKLFGDAMIKWYTNRMEQEKLSNPRDYERYLYNALADVCFFGINNNKPYLLQVEIVMKDKRSVMSIDKGTYISYQVLPVQHASLGYRDHIDAFDDLKVNQLLTDKRPVIYGLENLIKIEASYHPDDVSEPIDLLEVKQSGANWIRKKQNCN